ncbi:MAG: tetratricopeptide repeat protein [Thermoplasmata archaeon]
MPGLQGRGKGLSLTENRDEAAYEGQLAELLAHLKVEPGNPDLWMEAATIYMALGRRHRASKAYRASVEAVDERKQGEEEALATVHRLLHGDDVPSGEDGSNPESPSQGPRGGSVTAPQQSLEDDSDVVDQLRQELTPHQTVTCPYCNTLMEAEEPWCAGCGRELQASAQTLEERVVHARERLEEDEDDPDALFTVAAHLAVSGQHEEALEYLIRLTALDPRYPGLWWVKARVFLAAGKQAAAEASLSMAYDIMMGQRPGDPA